MTRASEFANDIGVAPEHANEARRWARVVLDSMRQEVGLPPKYPIPEGSMRVGPGTDAVVWRICPTHKAVP